MAKDKSEIAEEQQLREKPINIFTCQKCKDSGAMEFEEFKHHLFSVHELKADQLKGKKQMIMHMDGSWWYSSTYQWTLDNGVTFQQFTKNARSKNSPMR